MPQHHWAALESLNKTELGKHLSVPCARSINRIIDRIGLEPVAGGYPWRRIFRAAHRTEDHLLPGHLAHLKARFGTPAFEDIEDDAERAAARARAQGSPIIDAITDLRAELKAPLWSFAEMACALGKRPNTLSRAMAEGRHALAIPTLRLGPRLRLYRPLEVRLWRDENILLDLPPPMSIDPRTMQAAPPATARGAGRRGAPTPADQAAKAVFGAFADANGRSAA